MGFVLLAILTAVTAVAAVTLATRMRFEGRAELALASSLWWAVLVAAPIYALGLENVLTAKTLAPTSVVSCTLVVAACSWRVGVRTLAREVWTSLKQLALLPIDGIVTAIRARSFVVLAVVVTAFFLGWVTVSSYFVPSWHGWDSLWYHEAIIGYSIQSHGFGPFDVPESLEKINGYPRLCEMLDLWFAIFTDRRLVDLASCLMAPSLLLGTYVLARRFVDTTAAMGFACALAMTPMCTNTIQCTYVDVQGAALLVGAIAFATRPVLRLRDAILASFAIGMSIAAKPHALIVFPFLVVAVVVRLVMAHRKRPGALIGVVLLGAGIIFAFGAATYLRNLMLFHNPLWPDFKYDNEAWNIHWKGSYEWGQRLDVATTAPNQLDMNEPMGDLASDVLSPPYSWSRWHYGEVHEYGVFVWWLAFPLAFVAIFANAFVVVRGLIGKVFKRPQWFMAPHTLNATMLIALVAVMARFSPALWAARYQIPMVAVALAVTAWLTGRWPRMSQELSAFVFVGALVSQWWSPHLWLWPSELSVFVKAPYPARELIVAKDVGPTVDIRMGSPTVTETGMARERELGKDSVIVYDDYYGSFPTLFWNDRYDNKVVYVPIGPDWLSRAEQQNPTWAFMTYGDPSYSQMAAANSGWEQVGVLYVENWGVVFRRKR
jgi:hypothetical protein